MITSDNNFADIIFKEAQHIIKDLKKKIKEKITKNKNPNNRQNTRSPNNRLIPTEQTQKLKQISLLPTSKEIINIFKSF